MSAAGSPGGLQFVQSLPSCDRLFERGFCRIRLRFRGGFDWSGPSVDDIRPAFQAEPVALVHRMPIRARASFWDHRGIERTCFGAVRDFDARQVPTAEVVPHDSFAKEFMLGTVGPTPGTNAVLLVCGHCNLCSLVRIQTPSSAMRPRNRSMSPRRGIPAIQIRPSSSAMKSSASSRMSRGRKYGLNRRSPRGVRR